MSPNIQGLLEDKDVFLTL